MKIDRLLGIVTLLLQRDRMTAPELAEIFEVSRRTIQRDIDDICQAGIPIVTYQGGSGGIAIADNFKLDKSVLTIADLQSIIAGLRSIGSVSNSPRIEHLIAQLSPQGQGVMPIRDSILIDLSSHFQTSLSEKIALLRDAIHGEEVVSFDYYSEKGVVGRTVEPYAILFRWTSWYLLGYCRDRAGFRLFKLNRLWSCRRTGESFSPREVPEEEFDQSRSFSNGSRLTALFDRSVEYLVVEAYGPDSYQETPDGRLRFSVDYTNKDYIISWVLGFGDRAKVIEPDELADEIRERAQNIVKSYEHDR